MRFFWILVGSFSLVILLTVAFLGFNKPKTTTPNTTKKAVVMSDFATTAAKVSYTVEGIVNGNEAHRAIRITIDKNSRMLEVIAGYQGTVIQTQSFANNSDAFKVFLAALQKQGFLVQRVKPTVTDILGQCAFGQKYIYNTFGITDAPNYLWSASCPKIGTFNGSQPGVQLLFRNQIPGYSALVSGVNLQ